MSGAVAEWFNAETLREQLSLGKHLLFESRTLEGYHLQSVQAITGFAGSNPARPSKILNVYG
jgi:hypothetical protein